jgi:hypothetical protein
MRKLRNASRDVKKNLSEPPPVIFQRMPDGTINVLLHQRFRRPDGSIDLDLVRYEKALADLFPHASITHHY